MAETGNNNRTRNLTILIVLVIALLLALTYRATMVGEYLANDSVAIDNPLSATFLQDSSFFLFVLGIIFLSAFISQVPAIPFLLRLAVAVLLILYCVDILLFDFLAIRLEFGDLLRYGKELSAGYSLLSNAQEFSLPPKLAAALPFLVAIMAFLLVYLIFGISSDKDTFILLFIVACIPLTGHALSDTDYSTKEWIYKNFLALNINNTNNTGYSEQFIEKLNARPIEELACQEGKGKQPNIILLIVESLSNYHSRLYSGLNDWTPNFDAIAKDNIYYTNFYANGFTSEHGLISLFTGKPFVPGVGEFSYKFLGVVGNSFPRYSNPETLASSLNQSGYQTIFLTSGNLRFSGKGDWLQKIQFRQILGHDLPDYNGWPRLHFQSTPDEALYQAALRITQEQDTSRPYFLAIETVSSHLPYRSHLGPPHTEERVIRYVDEQLGIYYKNLRQTDFFDNGILIIVSDHRAMTPAWPGEIEIYALSTPSLTPAAVVWDQLPKTGPVNTLLQQTDLRSSLERLVTENPCVPADSGHFLTPDPSPSRCVLHAMGQQREMVYTRCGNSEGLVKLDGDNTRLAQGMIPDLQPVLDKINRLRIPSTKQPVTR